MNRFLLAALGAAGLVVCVSGCSDSSRKSSVASTVAPQTSQPGSPVGTSTFAVLVTTPVDGATDVRVDDAVHLTFTEDVDPASLLGAVTLQNDQGPVLVDVTLTTPRVVTITPRANLSSITPHLVRITTGLLATGGQALAQETLVRFTTAATVPVVGGGPGGPIAPATAGAYQAGAAAVDITPPIGVPLAGYGGGDRRHTPLPDFNPFNYYTFMNPSTGTHDALWAKALVIDNGHDRVAIVTLDAIATDVDVAKAAINKAIQRGLSVPLEKVLICASHTHSGPGVVSRQLVWQIITTDLFQQTIFDLLTDKIADALVQADQSVGPARIGVSTTQVTTATRNRRHSDSPRLNVDSIDPEMVVVRVDRDNGAPLATIWNFAIHGTHFGASSLDFSADIMGSANIKAEAAGAGMSMFINGCEGDIKPSGGYDATGQLLADAIMLARGNATTAQSGVLQSVHEQVDLGQPMLSLALHRNAPNNIRSNWFVQGLTNLGINVGVNFNIPNGWIEREFRFQAIRLGKTVFSSLPGEPIHEIGLLLKQDGRTMGFDHVITAALANGHGSYFTTDQEFQYGGYEGMASMFGANNGTKLMDAARRQMDKVRP